MELKIDSQRAISLIESKIQELNDYEFDSTYWKESCFNILDTIFSGVQGITVSYQIKGIDFSPIFSQNKAKSLAESKSTARKLLQSYIKLIQDHQVSESSTLQQTLHEKNNLLKSINSLQADNTRLRSIATEGISKIASLEKEVAFHKARYIDFDTITSRQLWEFLSEIPIKKIWPYLLIVSILVSGAFGIGTWVASIKANKEIKP